MTIVSGLFATLSGQLFGRREDGLSSPAAVAAVMALHNPLVLGEVGFQLSFLAALGLALSAGRRGAVLLLEWRGFHALLPSGLTWMSGCAPKAALT